MKKSIKVKGIKKLERVEMKNSKAGGICGYIDRDISIECTDSFTHIVLFDSDDIVANHFILIEY